MLPSRRAGTIGPKLACWRRYYYRQTAVAHVVLGLPICLGFEAIASKSNPSNIDQAMPLGSARSARRWHSVRRNSSRRVAHLQTLCLVLDVVVEHQILGAMSQAMRDFDIPTDRASLRQKPIDPLRADGGRPTTPATAPKLGMQHARRKGGRERCSTIAKLCRFRAMGDFQPSLRRSPVTFATATIQANLHS